MVKSLNSQFKAKLTEAIEVIIQESENFNYIVKLLKHDKKQLKDLLLPSLSLSHYIV